MNPSTPDDRYPSPLADPGRRRLAIAALSTVALGVEGCAGPSPATAPAPTGSTIPPNPNLHVEGIPPIPVSLAAQVAAYTDFRGHAFEDWHPTRREMLVTHRPAGGNVAQLFRIAAPMAAPEPLTDGDDPVQDARYEPREGRFVVFSRGRGGNEEYKVYRLDPADRVVTPLTDTPERHSLEAWLNRSSRLLVLSSPVDRTAAAGTRAEVAQTLRLIDPLDPSASRVLATLPGGGWSVGAVSRDDRLVALTRYLSAAESQIWLLDLAADAGAPPRQLLPSPGDRRPATHLAGDFLADGSGLLLVSDRDGEFDTLMRYRFADATLQPISTDLAWNVDAFSLDASGTTIAARANVDGRRELRFYDATTLAPRPLPAPPPPGSLAALRCHPSLPVLALATSSARGPGQVWSVDLASGGVDAWTRPAAPAGIDTRRFAEPTVVRWPSFDGRTISGILSRPPARFTGRRPVVIDIHGGPEAQATLGFNGRANHWIAELGIALIRPNVRGSSGYGKTFLSLDDGYRREDSVRDIGALLDWIATRPDLDPRRVAVIGGSYGGYMSLAVATTYADRIAGAVDVVGISNFLSFLKNTESYRRDLRRVEYGDERDPAMRAFLERISPLTDAGRITRPLFVVQGKNDPRVPVTEAEQIVARVRANGTPVWYLRAENEGHGFARKENADFQFYAMTLFLRWVLRLDGPTVG